VIYLLINDESTGPHAPKAVQAMLDNGQITSECPACINGMGFWRSVGETMMWARAQLLGPIQPDVETMVQKIAAGRLDLAGARVGLRKALHDSTLDMDVLEPLCTILVANAYLLQKCQRLEESQHADVLRARPAAELVCVESEPRFPRDWPTIWHEAGGKSFDGRLIARKDDPVWLAISDFGYPFSPFSFDLAMDMEDVAREDAVKLGVLGETDVIQPIKLDKGFKLVGIVEAQA